MMYAIAGRGVSRRTLRTLAKALEGSALVVVDRRVADRRAPARACVGADRRVADRRTLAIPAPAPDLPRRLRRRARSVRFVTRLDVPAEYLDAVASARLALAAQGGGRGAMLALYEAHFERVYAFARVHLRDADLAEIVTQRTFAAMATGISGFDPREEPFRTWLFSLVVDEIGELDEPEPQGPVRGIGRAAAVDPGGLSPLRWVADRELRLLVERLPQAQRLVVLLRHLAGLPAPVVARLLALPPQREEELHAAAISSITRTLAGLGAAQNTMQQREHMRRLPGLGRVLRERRTALKG